MLVCFAFVLCHVLTFVRYIGVYYRFGIVLRRISLKSKLVISRFCPIHFTVTLAELKSILRYNEDFFIERFIKSRFYCNSE